ncbi:hypothetical protein RI367_004371 [Sorochytrium milnesiophthora]
MHTSTAHLILAVLVLAAMAVTAAPAPDTSGCYEYGFFVTREAVSGGQAAEDLCPSLGGYALAHITNADFLYARAAIFDCLGPNTSAWIDSYEGQTYAPQCPQITTGSTRDPIGRLVGAEQAVHTASTLGPIDCAATLPVICARTR